MMAMKTTKAKKLRLVLKPERCTTKTIKLIDNELLSIN